MGPAEIVAGQGAWSQWRWVLEHKAGIEWVTGHKLESGCRYGSGREFGFGY